MRPGLLLVGHQPPGRLLEMAQHAERSGYGAAWVADERFFREVYTILAMLAVGTREIGLGPCVTDPFSRHPAMTAAAIATLDELSGGRALLGFGTGLSGFAEMGIAPRKPVRAMREALDVIGRLIAGAAADLDGEVVTFHGGKLGFTPVRARIPVYIASNGPLGQALAGRVANAAIMEGCGTVREAGAFVARVRAAAVQAGRPADAVACIARLNCCIDADDRGAHDLLRLRAAKTMTGGYLAFTTHGQDGLALDDVVRNKVAGVPYGTGNAPYEAILGAIEDRHVDAVTLAGTREGVARRVADLVGAGIEGFIISPVAPPAGSVLDVIRDFGAIWQEVAPSQSKKEPT